MPSDNSWRMPKVSLGDIVLFSTDCHSFSKPAVAFVTQVGDTTINLATLTQAGVVWQSSVHHRSDPALHGDHGWHDLGVWDFTDLTKATYAAAASKNNAEPSKGGK